MTVYLLYRKMGYTTMIELQVELASPLNTLVNATQNALFQSQSVLTASTRWPGDVVHSNNLLVLTITPCHGVLHRVCYHQEQQMSTGVS